MLHVALPAAHVAVSNAGSGGAAGTAKTELLELGTYVGNVRETMAFVQHETSAINRSPLSSTVRDDATH